MVAAAIWDSPQLSSRAARGRFRLSGALSESPQDGLAIWTKPQVRGPFLSVLDA